MTHCFNAQVFMCISAHFCPVLDVRTCWQTLSFCFRLFVWIGSESAAPTSLIPQKVFSQHNASTLCSLVSAFTFPHLPVQCLCWKRTPKGPQKDPKRTPKGPQKDPKRIPRSLRFPKSSFPFTGFAALRAERRLLQAVGAPLADD